MTRSRCSEAATGRWHSILTELGKIDPWQLDGKGRPCPICREGTDRFTFDDKEGRGTWICRQCPARPGKDAGAGDGMALLQAVTGWDFQRAADEVERFLDLPSAPLGNGTRPSPFAAAAPAREPAPALPAIPRGEIHLLRLPEIPTDTDVVRIDPNGPTVWLKKKVSGGKVVKIEYIKEAAYRYKASQGVWRLMPVTGGKKSFHVLHIKGKEWDPGAGPDPWPLWRQVEAVAAAEANPNRWLLETEGEKAAELAREAGLACISQPGHAHSLEQIKPRYEALKVAGVAGILYLADEDNTGLSRAQRALEAAAAVRLPLVVLPAADVWPSLPEGGSIDDATGTPTERVAALESALATIQPQEWRTVWAEWCKRIDPREEEQPAAADQGQQADEALTAEEKLAVLRQLASKLLQERVGFSERLPILRDHAGRIHLAIRDAELLSMLTAARRRRLGGDGLLRTGDRLDLAPVPWACEGLILRGCLNLLVALPKQGKTSLVVALIAAWHHGAGAFLNRPLHGPCPPVLLIGTDQGQADWGRLLQPAGLVDGDGRILLPILSLAHAGRPVHLDPEGIDLIAERAQQHPGLLVVIDSLAACIAPLGLKEESPEVAMPVAELMEQLEPHGATVILIHHSSKGRAGEGATSASRGSTALPALASQILKLGPASAGNPQDRRRVLSTEGRGGNSLALVIEREDSGWIIHGGMETLERERDQAETLSKLNDRQADCLEVVKERWADGLQRTTAADVVAALGLAGKDPQTAAWRNLKQLERRGLVQGIRQADQFGSRGAHAFWPTADTLPTLSRELSINTVGSVGSVGSGPLAREDPERDGSVFSSGNPTTDTTDTQTEAPARGVGRPSVVASVVEMETDHGFGPVLDRWLGTRVEGKEAA